jgi:hypothetical protein
VQYALKGILSPFETALKGISDPFANCRKVFDYRMQYSLILTDFFGFALHAIYNPFLQAAKSNLIPLELEQKEASNTFK